MGKFNAFCGFFIVFVSILRLNNAFDLIYYNHDELTELLKNYSTTYPDKTYLYSIGKSVLGRDLWVLALSNESPNKPVLLKPEVKYIGNIHGNEASSRVLLVKFIDYLLTNPNDPDVDYLMKNMRIHILVSINPDGFALSNIGDCGGVTGRNNANNYNLNRNFQDLFECNTSPLQPETLAIMRWLENNKFVLSANFHSGAVIANYPWDNYINGSASFIQKESISDDDALFISLAKGYSYNHRKMRLDPCNTKFFSSEGITNGAEWYPLIGGMQDYNYWRHGCMELTMEISCCKFPPLDDLYDLWMDNKLSLLRYLKQANTGVKGLISFSNGLPAKYVTIQIDSIEPVFKTNEIGEYFRLLLPGTYNLTILYDCKPVFTTRFQISDRQPLVVLSIKLDDNLYQEYTKVEKSLDKFAKFCTPSRQPIACPNYDENKNTGSSIKPANILFQVTYLFSFVLFLISKY